MSHNTSGLVAAAAVLLVSCCGLALVFRNAARRRQKNSNMSLFKTPKEDSSQNPIPVIHFDAERRYDIYCWLVSEQRLYENVKVTGIRTFDKITQFSSGAIGGLLEIEAANGTRMMIPQHGIQMICEHGTQLTYKVIGRLLPPR